MRNRLTWLLALSVSCLLFAALGSSTVEARGIHRYVHRHHGHHAARYVAPRPHVYAHPRVYAAPGVNVVAPGVRVGVGYGVRVYAYPGVRVNVGPGYRSLYYGW